MSAALLVEPYRIESRRIPVPAVGPGEMLVRVLASGICGSDLAVYRGHHPYKTAPVVLGHELCGRVTVVGDGVSGFGVGDLVCAAAYAPCDTCAFCRSGAENRCPRRRNLCHRGWEGSFAEYVLLSANMAFAVPPALGAETGALVEPLTIGHHAMGLVRRLRGSTVAVLGTGSIGLACLLAARRREAGRIVCVDVGPDKRAIAAALGSAGYVDAARDGVVDGVLDELPGGADVTVVAAGYPDVVTHAAAVTRPGGQIVVVSYFDGPRTLDLNPLVSAELVVRFSALSTRTDFAAVLGDLDSGDLEPGDLVTDRFTLDDTAAAMALMDGSVGALGKVLISVPDTGGDR